MGAADILLVHLPLAYVLLQQHGRGLCNHAVRVQIVTELFAAQLHLMTSQPAAAEEHLGTCLSVLAAAKQQSPSSLLYAARLFDLEVHTKTLRLLQSLAAGMTASLQGPGQSQKDDYPYFSTASL